MSRLIFGEIMFRTVITAGVIALPLVTAAPALAGPGTVSCSFPCTIIGETLSNYAGLPAATVGSPTGYAALPGTTAGNYAAFIPNTIDGYASLPATTANGYADFIPTTIGSPTGYAAFIPNTIDGYASLPGNTLSHLFPVAH
jgi:hypothetical protein